MSMSMGVGDSQGFLLTETDPNANDANAQKLVRIICRVNNALFIRGAWTVHNMAWLVKRLVLSDDSDEGIHNVRKHRIGS
jgi:hypothetical protein